MLFHGVVIGALLMVLYRARKDVVDLGPWLNAVSVAMASNVKTIAEIVMLKKEDGLAMVSP